MEFELSIQTSGVPEIKFVGYEKTLDDVRKLADSMKQQEVTEETIIENKKLLAAVRKQIKALDAERLSVKREIMTPYDVLNEKINVLKSILSEGETSINVQIKEFTAKEQELRKLQIKELFEKYQESYRSPRWLSFDRFIMQNQSLVSNKSTSAKKIRESIVSYFESFKQDYASLKEEFPDKDDRSAVLMSYSKNGFNMELAIADYLEMIREKERLEKEQYESNKRQAPKIVILTGQEQKQEAPKPVEEYVTIRVKKSDLAKINVEYEVIK